MRMSVPIVVLSTERGVIAGGVIGSLFALASIVGIVFAVAYYKKSKNTDGASCGYVVGRELSGDPWYRKQSRNVLSEFDASQFWGLLTMFVVCMYVCMYVCMHVCMYVRRYV